MATACVFEQKAVMHELTQGIQMAKQLRSNLNSIEARDFLIPKILSAYENALHVLKSGNSAGQPQSAAQPAPSVLESSISLESPGSEGGQHGQNVISKKRKGSPTWDDQGRRMYTDNGLEGNTEDSTVYEISYKGRHTCNQYRTQSAVPQPPSPEKYEIKPTNHQLSPPTPVEMLSNLKANLSVITSDFSDADIPSSVSFPSTSLEFVEDYFDEELFVVYSPPFISPDESETSYFPEWTPSLDFLASPAVVNPGFEFDNCLF